MPKSATVIAAAIGATLAVPVAAQTRTGAVIGGTVGVLSMDSGSHAAVSGSIGYKFNSALSFGIELTGVPDLEPDFPDVIPLPLASPYFPIVARDAEGSAIIFTTNVRIDIPTTSRRMLPFVTGGGGVANVDERLAFTFQQSSMASSLFTELRALGLALPILNQSYPVRSSSTGLALTLGGGTSIMATDRFSIDVDLRYLRLEGETDRNAGRFSAGVSYRF